MAATSSQTPTSAPSSSIPARVYGTDAGITAQPDKKWLCDALSHAPEPSRDPAMNVAERLSPTLQVPTGRSALAGSGRRCWASRSPSGRDAAGAEPELRRQ